MARIDPTRHSPPRTMPFRVSLLSASRMTGIRIIALAAILLCLIGFGLDRIFHTTSPENWYPRPSWMPETMQIGWHAPLRDFDQFKREPIVFTFISWYESTAIEYGILLKVSPFAHKDVTEW